ncbi:MAG: YdbL family protein [Methylocystaceae bacterium]|nr:YdbL family protein [Methylocystaceae bacterium]
MVPVVFLMLGLFDISAGHAQSLDALRANGQIGEAFDGYARARDGSVQGTVQQINAKRREIYQQRAAQQGVSVDQVSKVYAKQILSKAPAGTWFLQPNGSWVQK